MRFFSSQFKCHISRLLIVFIDRVRTGLRQTWTIFMAETPESWRRQKSPSYSYFLHLHPTFIIIFTFIFSIHLLLNWPKSFYEFGSILNQVFWLIRFWNQSENPHRFTVYQKCLTTTRFRCNCHKSSTIERGCMQTPQYFTINDLYLGETELN